MKKLFLIVSGLILGTICFSQSKFTMDNLNSENDFFVMDGSAKVFDEGTFFTVLDFSSCIMNDAPVQEYLAGHGDDFVNDWPTDIINFKKELEKNIKKKHKKIVFCEDGSKSEHTINIHILRVDTGFFNPMAGFAPYAGGAALWGVVEVVNAEGQSELTISLYEFKGKTVAAETGRILMAFNELGGRLGKLK